MDRTAGQWRDTKVSLTRDTGYCGPSHIIMWCRLCWWDRWVSVLQSQVAKCGSLGEGSILPIFWLQSAPLHCTAWTDGDWDIGLSHRYWLRWRPMPVICQPARVSQCAAVRAFAVVSHHSWWLFNRWNVGHCWPYTGPARPWWRIIFPKALSLSYKPSSAAQCHPWF